MPQLSKFRKCFGRAEWFRGAAVAIWPLSPQPKKSTSASLIIVFHGVQVYVVAKECSQKCSMEEYAIALARKFVSTQPKARR